MRYLIVEPDGILTAFDGPLEDDELRGIVGGYLEMLPNPGVPGIAILGNEDAKRLELRPNKVMTRWLRDVIHPSDYIAGTVVIVGGADADGEMTSVLPAAERVIRAALGAVPL